MPDKHEVILEDCRWLFGQDVRIVTFSETNPWVYHTLILPKAYSLRSLSHGDINEKVLFHIHSRSDASIEPLYTAIKERISQIIKFDSNTGLYHVDKSKLPTEAPLVPGIPDQTQLNVIEDEALAQDVEWVDALGLERQGDVSQAQYDAVSRLSSVSTESLTQPPSNTELWDKAEESTGETHMGKTESKQGGKNNQPTTAVTDVKPLTVSTNRWRPRSVGASKETQEDPTTSEVKLSPELVQRKVRAALNKMTPEKFDKIANQILEITSQSKFETDGRTLRQVIQLTFEKATDEASWSSIGAKLCKCMLESMDPNIKDENICDKNGVIVTGGNLFRKYLLNRCQEEFERGWKVNSPPKPEGISDEGIMLDEYYIAAVARRRGLGLVQFIGELYKLGMLTERIMNECVRKLLDFEGLPEDETVESLCMLLKTVGFQLDASGKSQGMMDMYFVRISRMAEDKELNSRMRFKLMDIIDLRRKKWETKEVDKGPKTIQEVREDALRAQKEEAASRANNQRSRPGGGGRGGGRSYSNYGNQMPGWQDQSKGGLVLAEDFKRLKSRPVSSGPSSFGPGGMLGSRSSSSGGSRRGMGFGVPMTGGGTGDSNPSSRTATPPTKAPTYYAKKFSALLDGSPTHRDFSG